MRLFLLIVVAGVLSVAAGVGVVMLSSAVLPSYDDPAGRGLGEVFRLTSVVAYGLIAMLVFGRTTSSERMLRIALLTLLFAPVFLVLFGVMSDLTRRADLYAFKRQFFSAALVLLPLWSVTLVQWLVLRFGLNRHKLPA